MNASNVWHALGGIEARWSLPLTLLSFPTCMAVMESDLQKKRLYVKGKLASLIDTLVVFGAPMFIISMTLLGESNNEEAEIKWLKTEIYCGRSIPYGGQVSDSQFADFLNEVVTAEFPLGLTVFDAYGQMEEKSGTIVEQQTKVIVLVHEKSEQDGAKVQRIIDEYRSRFGNPQVMQISTPSEPEFYSE